jgi:phosphatidylglycerol---prolipoprotein diacylglyceryl transferase
MDPVIFQIGPLALRWYGLFIVGGAVISAWVAAKTAEKRGENPDHCWNLLAFCLILGIIGARLYHVFSTPKDGLGWAYYKDHPGDIFNFWNGGFQGLGIYGGLVGGVLAIIIYCWWNRLSIVRYLDYITPQVPIAQALGRMGNYVNQELYGPPTDLPWAFHINPAHPCQRPPNLPVTVQPCGSPPPFTQETLDWYANNGFHPTFFYEALWSILAFCVMAYIISRYSRRLRQGSGFWMYFIAYPLGRFWVELFRPDAWTIGNLPTAQWIAIGSIAISAIMLFLINRNWSWHQHPEQSMAYVNPSPVQAEGSAG